MKTFILIGLLLSCTAEAKFFCETTRTGIEIQSCGYGQGADENRAREKAFDAARSEFNKICESSADCKMREVIVMPSRSECEKTETGIECTRAITFILQKQIREKPITSGEKFDSFVYEESSKPKIGKGMSKSDLLTNYGKPDSVREEFGVQVFQYHGELCEQKSNSTLVSCTVKLEDGVVVGWVRVDNQYTKDLQ